MTLEKLFEYKAVKSNNNFVTLPDPEQVLAPALEILEPHVNKFNVYVQDASRQAVEADNTTEYKIADRVLVEAVLNPDTYQHGTDRFSTVIGFLWAHDTKIPTAKVYLGFENSACLNLSVFNAIDIVQKPFAANDFNSIYDSVRNFLNRAEARRETLVEAVEYMNYEILEEGEFNKVLGEVVVKAHLTQGMSSNASQMVDHLIKPKGRYYKSDKKFTRWDMYNALTFTMPKFDASTSSPVNIYAADKVLSAYQFFKG